MYYVKLCVKACNKSLNLHYAYSCGCVLGYLIHVLMMPLYIDECLKISGACILVNMLCLKKLDCPVLIERAYVSPNLIIVNPLSCASCITCSHTHLLHHMDA
jgi:hypothetical protein